MLSLLRKNAGSWMIKVLLGAIIIVFAFWGFGSYRERKRTTVATVNGQVISLSEFDETYTRLKEQLRQRFGNNLNEDMIKTLQLKAQALNELIDQRLLLEEANRVSLRVSDNELSKAIMSIGAFQSAGIFDSRVYHNVLSQMKLTPERFEDLQRDSMLINKLQSYLLSSAKATDQEAWEFYRWQNVSAAIDFILFDPNQYAGKMPTMDEIETYYEDHKSDYKTEPMVKVRYINFESRAYAQKADISDEDIHAYYEMNLKAFEIPKTVDARHILLRVDTSADSETIEKTKQKMLYILKMAKTGQDFGELATLYSEDPTKIVGGKLEPFERESMEKPFSDMAFSMKPGDISEPVRTRYGWHIIKVENIHEAATRSFADVQMEIREKLSIERGKELAYDAAQEVYDASFEGDDLIKAAKAKNLSVLTSEFFTQNDPDKAIKNRMKLATTAFDLSPMEISDILDHGEGYYILQVIEKRPEKTLDLKDVIDEVRAELIKKNQDEKASKAAEDFLSMLKKGNSMDEESKKLGMVSNSTGFFKRKDAIPKIGYEQPLSDVAFTLSEHKTIPDNIIKGKKGYYVICFKEKKEPEKEGFDQQKSEEKEKLLQQKKRVLFESMLSQVKKKSEIEIEERFLD